MTSYLQDIDRETLMEIGSVALSVGTFWIGARQYIITWPIGIGISLINIPLHYSSGLYDRCLVNVISIVSACYGWYRWLYGGKDRTRLKKLSKISLREGGALLAISPFYMTFLYSILIYINGNMPIWGAFSNTLTMIGMWMTANKKVETYIIWFFGNVISIYVFYQVSRPFFMAKYIFYLILSVKGYLLWRKQYQEQQENF